MKGKFLRVATIVSVGACALISTAYAADAVSNFELCPGFTVVTAVSTEDGDYESIKRITAMDENTVTIHYSNERMVSDFLSSDPPRLVRTDLDRDIRRTDLHSAELYLQQFDERLPTLVPETTAIGISTELFRKLKTGEPAKMGVFIAFSQTPSLDRNTHPNVYDNQMIAPVVRSESEPQKLRVIVDDRPVELPSIRVTGEFFGDKAEFWFLDDELNPITLRYRFGVDHVNIPADIATQLGIPVPDPKDKERFDVIKIASICDRPAIQEAAPPPAGEIPEMDGLLGAAGEGSSGSGSGGLPALAEAIEQALAEDGTIDLYTIHFSFAKANLRPESAETINAIATVLARHPEWKMEITGHTDSIGGDADNLKLSNARAGTVKSALVSGHKIDAERLFVAGRGETSPVSENDTPVGRALNRRVEIRKM
ncbi:MAG: OmpA family protein [Pseudomonadales bacterium]